MVVLDRPSSGRADLIGLMLRHPTRLDPVDQIECVSAGIGLEFERVMGVGIFDDGFVGAFEPLNVGPCARVVDDSVVFGEHEEAGLFDAGGGSSGLPIEERTGCKKGRGGSPQTQGVVSDEVLGLGVGREQGGIRQRNGEMGFSSHEKGSSNAEALGGGDPNPRFESRADQGDAVDRLRLAGR